LAARQSLQDEASCSICLEYFNDPVTIDCGHNFCRACITQCWEGSDKDVSCPQCRATFPQRNLRPNWQLASVVEIAKQLNLQSTKDAGAGRACEKHQETLKLFCQEDQSPICVVCDRSKEHRAHTVVPAEEAAQEYKVGRNARPAQLSDIATPRCVSCSVRQAQIGGEGSRPAAQQGAGRLPAFRGRWPHAAPRSRQLLARLCMPLAGGGAAPGAPAAPVPPKGHILSPTRSNLTPGLSSAPNALNVSLPPVNVTLDPDTAHPRLIVSEDRKSVRQGDIQQDLPDNPERFDYECCVLGCEGFTSGSHYWEVEAGDGKYWAVGVARASVSRKGEFMSNLNPKVGIWAVRLYGGQYQVLTSPKIPLTLRRGPSRIRVCTGGNIPLKSESLVFMSWEAPWGLWTVNTIESRMSSRRRRQAHCPRDCSVYLTLFCMIQEDCSPETDSWEPREGGSEKERGKGG
uniref:Zinc finger protein RFP-like n=1 Tax=Terrapene triunguis TaxID=2587831 RepID=A0A674IMP8_9SAUR